MERTPWSRVVLPAASLFLAAMLAGCQAPPNIKKLQDENGNLQQQLDQAHKDLDQLQTDKVMLQKNVTELNRVITVLGAEKSSRVAESTSLRGQIRRFVQQQIDNLKEFLLAADLVDYVGGELVERASVDDEARLVVDLLNPVPLDGTLTGVGGYFHGAGSVSVKVLRPVNEDLVVVWSSKPIAVAAGGLRRLKFPVVVGVEKGDILGYYFNKPGMISFDTGTGDSRYSSEDIAVGDSLRRSSLNGEKAKRAYSIGVFGLLNAR